MAMPQRIHTLTFGARSVGTLRAFYRGWGWTENDGSDDTYASFTAGDIRLALYPLDLLHDEAAAASPLAEPGTWNGVTLAINFAEPRRGGRGGQRRAGCRRIGGPPPDRSRLGWILGVRRRPRRQPLGTGMGTLLRSELTRVRRSGAGACDATRSGRPANEAYE